MREGLRNLEKKVEQLALAQEPGVEEGGSSAPVAPSNDAAVEVVAATEKSDSGDGGGGDATIQEELRALRTKVDIIAANVLGVAEGDSMDMATMGSSLKGKELVQGKVDDDESLRPDIETDEDTTNVAVNTTESFSPTDDDGEAMAEKDNLQREQEGGSVSPRLLPQRVKARSNWGKVRKNRAFLVKKIRRQVCTYA